MSKLIKLAITMGDPGGIGPEIALKAVYHSKWPDSTRFVLIGNKNIWLKYARQFRLPLPAECENASEITASKISIWDPATHSVVIPDLTRLGEAWVGNPSSSACGGLDSRFRGNDRSEVPCRLRVSRDFHGHDGLRWRPGKTGSSEGFSSLLWVRAAVAGCQEGKFHGLVTGPICKHSIQTAGYKFPGHTEYLAHLAGSKRVAMMLIGGPLRVVLASRHIALKQVANSLTRRVVIDAVEMAAAGAKWLNLPQKNISVCALNPHAGDAGLLGDEEIKTIAPAVRYLRRRGVKVEGPVPADVIFYQALKNKFGAVVAMYHDQGLGPLKMIAFEKGVNLTLGLPFVRTSPDHGTAFDIAGKGIASCSSMVEAIKLAIRLASRPNPWKK